MVSWSISSRRFTQTMMLTCFKGTSSLGVRAKRIGHPVGDLARSPCGRTGWALKHNSTSITWFVFLLYMHLHVFIYISTSLILYQVFRERTFFLVHRPGFDLFQAKKNQVSTKMVSLTDHLQDRPMMVMDEVKNWPQCTWHPLTRPPLNCWLKDEQSQLDRSRLKACGNIVIPEMAFMALTLMGYGPTPWFDLSRNLWNPLKRFVKNSDSKPSCRFGEVA